MGNVILKIKESEAKSIAGTGLMLASGGWSSSEDLLEFIIAMSELAKLEPEEKF